MKKFINLSLFTIIIILFTATPGLAWSYHNVETEPTFSSDARDCMFCHHDTTDPTGPHGNYTALSNKCSTCHQTHRAQNPGLLPANSLTAVCQYCHDLTQSIYAPYSFNDLGSADSLVYSAHRVSGVSFPNEYVNEMGELVTTEPLETGLTGDIIPGGSEIDGGTGSFTPNYNGSVSKVYFSCTSCHSVHAVKGTMVKPYLGESQLKVNRNMDSQYEKKIHLTNRLLRIRPNNVTEAVYEFGPLWCMTCHKGRGNNLIMSKFNHPINETAKGYSFLDILPESEFIYAGGKAATLNDIMLKGFVIIDSRSAESAYPEAHVKKDPRTNAWYTMSFWDSLDRKFREDGSIPYNSDGPVCQQCHGNPRDVEKAFNIGASNSNPRRLSFPHASPNKALLVETGVDLCTNCHEADSLP